MVSKFRLDNSKSAATKDAISRTLEIANNYAGELSIEVLPLNKIELDPENNRELTLTLEDAINGIDKNDLEYERKRNDWRSLESLAKTIKEDQLINPIYVYRFGNKCRLIAGERRTLASAIAGKKEIIARIAGQRPVGTKLKVLQWIENNERSDLSLAERITSLESILSEYKKENKTGQEKITGKLLGDLTGMSPTQARRYILILQSPPEIKTAIKNGQIENIKLIELICSVKSAEHQSQLLQAAISGATFEEVSRLKKELEFLNKKNKDSKLREKTTVQVGALKPNVAKLIIDALLASDVLADDLIKQVRQVCNNVKWNETKDTESGFKKIIALLNKGTVKA